MNREVDVSVQQPSVQTGYELAHVGAQVTAERAVAPRAERDRFSVDASCA